MNEKYNDSLARQPGAMSSSDIAMEIGELSIRQSKFVDLVLRGIPHGTAYEEAGYKARGDVADTCAARLLRNARVSKAIREARKELALASAMSREQMIAYLNSIMMTPIGHLTPDSPLIQKMTTSSVGQTNYVSIEMVSKIEAVKLLCKIMGWTSNERISEPVSTKVSQIIHLIRRRKTSQPG